MEVKKELFTNFCCEKDSSYSHTTEETKAGHGRVEDLEKGI